MVRYISSDDWISQFDVCPAQMGTMTSMESCSTSEPLTLSDQESKREDIVMSGLGFCHSGQMTGQEYEQWVLSFKGVVDETEPGDLVNVDL